MTENEKIVKLNIFLDALDEWGCDDNNARAASIIDFQRLGYDLSEYEENYDVKRPPLACESAMNVEPL